MENKSVSVMNKKNNQEVEEEDMVQLRLPPHLDENIITQILLKIPAETLFNTFRYVCKSWLKIISTHPCIHLNRLIPSKPPCLITQTSVYGESPDPYGLTTCFFTLTKEGMIEEQFDDLINPLFRNLFIKSCCNGLILALATTDKAFYDVNVYVVNPLTNYRLRIPYPPQYDILDFSDFKLLFIPSTGEYKVILVPENNNCIQILTLSAGDCYGSNDHRLLQWRLIEAPYKIPTSHSITARNFMFYWGTVIGNGKGMHIISFDASVEKFHKTTYPPPCNERDSRKERKMRLRESRVDDSKQVDMGLIEMGGLLSCWSLRPTKCDPGSARRLSVHVVKNFHEGEWIEKYSIEIDTKFGCPVFSFGNGEVLIFDNLRKNNTMWTLNVKLNQWSKVQEKFPLSISGFYGFHVNNKPVPLESIFAIESGAFKREEEEHSRK